LSDEEEAAMTKNAKGSGGRKVGEHWLVTDLR
jgi:hypothetical protein